MIKYVEFKKNTKNTEDAKSTDFRFLCQDPSQALLYAENLESYIKLLNGQSLSKGGGTAHIRGMSNAIPIVTGFKGEGFKELTQIVCIDEHYFKVQNIIDSCFDGFELLIKNNPDKFKRAIYSAKPGTKGQWGCGIYDVDPSILKYITDKIIELNKDKEFMECFAKEPELSNIRTVYNFEAYYTRRNKSENEKEGEIAKYNRTGKV